jgi:hypothetical protein
LVHGGLVEGDVRVGGGGGDRGADLGEFVGGGRPGVEDGRVHVVQELGEEQLLVGRRHRVDDDVLAEVDQPGGGQVGGQPRADGRVTAAGADGRAVDRGEAVERRHRRLGVQRGREQVLDRDDPAWPDRGPHRPDHRHRVDEVTQQQARERKVEVLLHRRGGVALDEADLDPGRRGSSAGDRDGPGVGVDPHHPTCWSDQPGERDADLPVAASDVETGHPGPDAGRGEERHRGRRHDRGLAGEPVRVGLSTVDGVPGPTHGPDATRRGHVP